MHLNRGLARAIGAREDFPEALAYRARVRLQTGDLRGATEDIESALKVAPSRWPPRKSLEERLRHLPGAG